MVRNVVRWLTVSGLKSGATRAEKPSKSLSLPFRCLLPSFRGVLESWANVTNPLMKIPSAGTWMKCHTENQKVVLCSKQCVSTVGKRKWRGNISNKKVFYICKTSSISLLSISGLSISVLFHFWTFHFWTFPFLDFPFLDSLKNRPLIVHFWTRNFHFSLSA